MERFKSKVPGLYPIVPNRAAENQAEKAKQYAQYGAMLLLFNITCGVFNLLLLFSVLFLAR